MTSLSKSIGILYLVFVVLGLILCAIVIASTRRGRAEGGQNAPLEKLERAEPWWGVFIVVLLGILLAFTIWQAPWFQDNDGPQQVKVTGVQFGFLVSPNTVKVGEKVTFTVSANDVNHAMGLYDSEDRLLLNVMAMPGYDIQRSYTFTKPGTYTMRCLEFCGYQHHKMIYPAFQVTS